MSLDTVQEVTSQPATPVAKTEEKKVGAANTSQNDFARKLAGSQVAPTAFAKAVETVTQEAPKTEEAKAPAAEVKAEEPKTEAKAETAEATETEIEEVLSPETHALDPKLQEILDKKINKEVGKRYKLKVEMEAKIAALEARISQVPEEVEKEVHVPVPTDTPLAHITSIEALNQYREALSNDIIEAEGLLYSDFPPEGLDTKWGKLTKPALIAALTQAKKDERTAVPAREKFLTTRSQSSQTAHEEFPFLKDPAHPGYQMAKQAKRDNPVLLAYPNADYLIGMLVEGQLAIQARKAGKVEAKATIKPKPIPTKGQSEIASDASMTRTPAGVASKQALDVEIAKITGGKKSLDGKQFAAVLLAKQRARNSQ